MFLFLFLCRNLKEDKTVWDFPWELREGGEAVKISNLAVTHGCLSSLGSHYYRAWLLVSVVI